MSIIYDALQKTQTVRQTTSMETTPQKPRFSINKINISKNFLLILFLLIFLGCIFFYANYYAHKKPQMPPAPLKVATVQHAAAKPPINLVLKGVFISENEKVALINNKMLHIGDSYQGIKVIAIQLDKVKLKKDNFEFFLSQR